jgi:hypothetical protein
MSVFFITCYVLKIINLCILAGIAGSCIPLHDSAALLKVPPLINPYGMPMLTRAEDRLLYHAIHWERTRKIADVRPSARVWPICRGRYNRRDRPSH